MPFAVSYAKQQYSKFWWHYYSRHDVSVAVHPVGHQPGGYAVASLVPKIFCILFYQEYDRGLNGRLAAKDWTPEQRGGGGGGGDNRIKQTY